MPDETPSCIECLAQVHPDWQFCSHCGSRLVPSRTIVPVAGTPLPPGIPACGNCNAAVDTTGSFCWRCGVPLETGRKPFIPAHPQSVPEPETDEDSLGAPVPSTDEDHRATSALSEGRTPRSRRPVAGGALLLVGVILVVAALFFGWYAYSITASDTVSGTTVTLTERITLYPLNQIKEAVTCQGWSECAQFNSTSTSSYSQGGSDGLGALYDSAAGLAVAGLVIGVVAAGLAFRGDRHQSGRAGTFAVLAVILVALAPCLLLVAQPTVISSQGAPYTGPGTVPGGVSPRTSFFGSCTQTGCGVSFPSGTTDNGSWGPAIGWYLSLAAIAPLIAGYLLVRPRKVAPTGAITPDMFE
jgi:hypothetical protein